VIVLNAQLATGGVPGFPVPWASLPFVGSTMYVVPLTAGHVVQTYPFVSQTELFVPPGRPAQYVLPAEPGQHASAPVLAMHGCALQHMSAAFTVQVPG
jgi:hypothetical protein